MRPALRNAVLSAVHAGGELGCESAFLPPSRPSLASRPSKVILYDLTNWFRACVLYTTNFPFCVIPIHL